MKLNIETDDLVIKRMFGNSYNKYSHSGNTSRRDSGRVLDGDESS